MGRYRSREQHPAMAAGEIVQHTSEKHFVSRAGQRTQQSLQKIGFRDHQAGYNFIAEAAALAASQSFFQLAGGIVALDGEAVDDHASFPAYRTAPQPDTEQE